MAPSDLSGSTSTSLHGPTEPSAAFPAQDADALVLADAAVPIALAATHEAVGSTTSERARSNTGADAAEQTVESEVEPAPCPQAMLAEPMPSLTAVTANVGQPDPEVQAQEPATGASVAAAPMPDHGPALQQDAAPGEVGEAITAALFPALSLQPDLEPEAVAMATPELRGPVPAEVLASGPEEVEFSAATPAAGDLEQPADMDHQLNGEQEDDQPLTERCDTAVHTAGKPLNLDALAPDAVLLAPPASLLTAGVLRDLPSEAHALLAAPAGTATADSAVTAVVQSLLERSTRGASDAESKMPESAAGSGHGLVGSATDSQASANVPGNIEPSSTHSSMASSPARDNDPVDWPAVSSGPITSELRSANCSAHSVASSQARENNPVDWPAVTSRLMPIETGLASCSAHSAASSQAQDGGPVDWPVTTSCLVTYGSGWASVHSSSASSHESNAHSASDSGSASATSCRSLSLGHQGIAHNASDSGSTKADSRTPSFQGQADCAQAIHAAPSDPSAEVASAQRSAPSSQAHAGSAHSASDSGSAVEDSADTMSTQGQAYCAQANFSAPREPSAAGAESDSAHSSALSSQVPAPSVNGDPVAGGEQGSSESRHEDSAQANSAAASEPNAASAASDSTHSSKPSSQESAVAQPSQLFPHEDAGASTDDLSWGSVRSTSVAESTKVCACLTLILNGWIL